MKKRISLFVLLSLGIISTAVFFLNLDNGEDVNYNKVESFLEKPISISSNETEAETFLVEENVSDTEKNLNSMPLENYEDSSSDTTDIQIEKKQSINDSKENVTDMISSQKNFNDSNIDQKNGTTEKKEENSSSIQKEESEKGESSVTKSESETIIFKEKTVCNSTNIGWKKYLDNYQQLNPSSVIFDSLDQAIKYGEASAKKFGYAYEYDPTAQKYEDSECFIQFWHVELYVTRKECDGNPKLYVPATPLESLVDEITYLKNLGYNCGSKVWKPIS